MKPPCYVCGAPSIIDGLCSQCYDKAHPLVAVDNPLDLILCKKCGAVKVPGGWQPLIPFPNGPEEMIRQQITILLTNEISLLRTDAKLDFVIKKQLDRVCQIDVIAHGRSHPTIEPHEETLPVEIRVQYSTCNSCSMMHGGYYEAILQIRADRRQLSDEEANHVMAIITQIVSAEYGHDSKAFISHISQNRYGLDFHIGSEHLSQKIADEIESVFLAERKETYKLVTRTRSGKNKYRVTILLRFPRFKVGDFILVANNPCQILSLGRGGLTCYDLVNQSRFTINPKSAKWRTIEFLETSEKTRKFSIIAKGYHQPVQLMDSETFETIEVDFDKIDSTLCIGDIVYGVWIDNRFYLVPSIVSKTK